MEIINNQQCLLESSCSGEDGRTLEAWRQLPRSLERQVVAQSTAAFVFDGGSASLSTAPHISIWSPSVERSRCVCACGPGMYRHVHTYPPHPHSVPPNTQIHILCNSCQQRLPQKETPTYTMDPRKYLKILKELIAFSVSPWLGIFAPLPSSLSGSTASCEGQARHGALVKQPGLAHRADGACSALMEFSVSLSASISYLPGTP